MTRNALFYTFSTIPQTFAGAIALLAAFLLYRLLEMEPILETPSPLMAVRFIPGSPPFCNGAFGKTKQPSSRALTLHLSVFTIHFLEIGRLAQW